MNWDNKRLDKSKACFPIKILGSSVLLSQSRIWVCALILIFPYPNMFRMSAKVVLRNSVTSDMSGGFLLMMILYLWPVLLLVVGRITVTHFSGVSPNSIHTNYSGSKVVPRELYQTPVDTPV